MLSRLASGFIAGVKDALTAPDPGPWSATLHLFALSGFAIAQPLYDVMAKHVDFFVAHDSQPVDLVLLTVLFSVAIPSVMALVVWLAGLVHLSLRRVVLYAVLGALTGLTVLPVLKKVEGLSDPRVLALAALAAAVFLVAYARLPRLRDLLSILSLGTVVFPLYFLTLTEARVLVFPERPEGAAAETPVKGPPVVMVVFEEFSVVSLMDERRRIDAVRYPNFAALADQAHWFRNYTVHSPSTRLSVASMLTGRYVERGKLFQAENYPQSLFTLLGPGYRMVVRGFSKDLCPADYQVAEVGEPLAKRLRSMLRDVSTVYLHIVVPRRLSQRLPRVTDDWRDFVVTARAAPKGVEAWRKAWRKIKKGEDFDSFIEVAGRVPGPTLYYLHTKLVHNPWILLPSGKRYGGGFEGFRRSREDVKEIEGFGGKLWSTDEWLVTQAYQRHLLEVSAADRKLGALIGRLKETGIFDESLIVITADHGLSFEPGGRNRGRKETILSDGLAVPMIMKLPQQRTGVVSDDNLEAIDLLPTMAEALGVELRWAVDGRSAFDSSSPPREEKTLLHLGERLSLSAAGTMKFQRLERKLALFGSGSTRPDGYFSIGPYGDLVGRSLDELPGGDADGGRLTVRLSQEVGSLDLETEDVLPALVSGEIVGDAPPEAPVHLAIAVNGLVQAVTRTERQPPGDATRFYAMVPEEAFRSGWNELAVFLVSADEGREVYLSPVLHEPS